MDIRPAPTGPVPPIRTRAGTPCPAAIVVDQKPPGGNSRSTVGTMTDIHSLLRLLFSKIGEPSAGTSSAFSFNSPAAPPDAKTAPAPASPLR